MIDAVMVPEEDVAVLRGLLRRDLAARDGVGLYIERARESLTFRCLIVEAFLESAERALDPTGAPLAGTRLDGTGPGGTVLGDVVRMIAGTRARAGRAAGLPDPLVAGLLVRALLPDDRGDLLARLRDRVIAALLAALVAGDCPDGDGLDARLAAARTRAGAVLQDMASERHS